jgi:CRP/FNR family cyclic AMP-dependent transcriptional regulator
MSGRVLDDLTLFQGLNQEDRERVLPLFVPDYFPTGTVLFDQGDLAERLYIILEGEVSIRYKPEDGPALIVARVHDEGVVGWSAAIGSPTYTSAAVCTTDCHVLCVRSLDLRQLCEGHPQTGSLLLERLAALIAERLRNTHPQVIAMLEHGLRADGDKPFPNRWSKGK